MRFCVCGSTCSDLNSTSTSDGGKHGPGEPVETIAARPLANLGCSFTLTLLLFLPPSHLISSLLCRTICSCVSCAIMPVLLFSRMAIFQRFSYLPTIHLTARCADTPLSPYRACPDRKPQTANPSSPKPQTPRRPPKKGEQSLNFVCSHGKCRPTLASLEVDMVTDRCAEG